MFNLNETRTTNKYEQLSNLAQELKNIDTIQRGNMLWIAPDKIDTVQKEINSLRQQLQSELGVSHATIEVTIRNLEMITGGSVGLDILWRNKGPRYFDSVKLEEIFKISKKKKWNFEGLKRSSNSEKKALIKCSLAIATMQQALKRSRQSGVKQQPEAQQHGSLEDEEKSFFDIAEDLFK